jgi:hypothetical protein
MAGGFYLEPARVVPVDVRAPLHAALVIHDAEVAPAFEVALVGDLTPQPYLIAVAFQPGFFDGGS